MDKHSFDYLLNLTKEAFNNSDIKNYAKNNNFSWFYLICSTKITENRPLIVGINWGGAKKDIPYPPQKCEPNSNLLELCQKKELGSLNKIIPFLKKFYNEYELKEIGQTNFCFFRSNKAKELSPKDFELSKGIFLEFLKIMRPSNILFFSKDAINYLKDFIKIEYNNVNKIFNNQQKKFFVGKGLLSLTDFKIPIISIPHPNSWRVSTTIINTAWDFAFDKIDFTKF